VDRTPEPAADLDERQLLLTWLAFHRDALAAKCEGVGPAELVRTGLGGTTMSLLGLVRHLTEMERAYFVHAIAGTGGLTSVYGPYVEGEPEGDFDNLNTDDVQPSFDAWFAERRAADELLARPSLDAIGTGNRRSLRWNLLMVIQEYARHNGHADLIRQSIDGQAGQ